MKGVRCSWVDAKKRADQLCGAERGDQERLSQLVCVGKSTVGNWAVVRDFIEITDGKVQISALSEFQPYHAEALMRHYRKQYGKSASNWDAEVIDELADWVERVESEELTVKQLRELLKEPERKLTETEAATLFADFVDKLLDKFPRDRQAVLADYFEKQLAAIRDGFSDGHRGEGDSSAGPDSCRGENDEVFPFSRTGSEA
jgi:hypothetical protein